MSKIVIHRPIGNKELIRKVLQEELSGMFTSNEKEDKILTRSDIMEMFHIGETTVWKRMKDKTLPYFKIGRKVFFWENEVKAALKNSNQE